MNTSYQCIANYIGTELKDIRCCFQGGRFRGVTRADIVRKLEDDFDVIGVVWSSLKPSWHYIDDVMRHGMIREIDSSPQSPLDASKSKFSYSQQAEESLKFFDYIREIRQTDFKPEGKL